MGGVDQHAAERNNAHLLGGGYASWHLIKAAAADAAWSWLGQILESSVQLPCATVRDRGSERGGVYIWLCQRCARACSLR